MATAAGIAALALASIQLMGVRLPLPQRDRETPFRWVQAGPVKWALATGAVLGLGMTTRIGFWPWYFVPLGAFVLGDPRAGALVYAAYAFTRSVSALGLAHLATGTRRDVSTIGRTLVANLSLVIRYSAIHCLALGIVLVAYPSGVI